MIIFGKVATRYYVPTYIPTDVHTVHTVLTAYCAVHIVHTVHTVHTEQYILHELYILCSTHRIYCTSRTCPLFCVQAISDSNILIVHNTLTHTGMIGTKSNTNNNHSNDQPIMVQIIIIIIIRCLRELTILI